MEGVYKYFASSKVGIGRFKNQEKFKELFRKSL